MKKLALLLGFAVLATPLTAGDSKPAGDKVAKTHEVTAEVVSVDATAKTITVKTGAESKTVPVDETGLAAVKTLKPGQTATLVCRDDAKGGHEAVVGVKAPATQPTEKK